MKPLRVRNAALPAQVAVQASIAAAVDRAQDAAAPAQDAMARHAATAAAAAIAAVAAVRAASVSPTKIIAKLRANRASRAGNPQPSLKQQPYYQGLTGVLFAQAQSWLARSDCLTPTQGDIYGQNHIPETPKRNEAPGKSAHESRAPRRKETRSQRRTGPRSRNLARSFLRRFAAHPTRNRFRSLNSAIS